MHKLASILIAAAFALGAVGAQAATHKAGAKPGHAQGAKKSHKAKTAKAHKNGGHKSHAKA